MKEIHLYASGEDPFRIELSDEVTIVVHQGHPPKAKKDKESSEEIQPPVPHDPPVWAEVKDRKKRPWVPLSEVDATFHVTERERPYGAKRIRRPSSYRYKERVIEKLVGKRRDVVIRGTGDDLQTVDVYVDRPTTKRFQDLLIGVFDSGIKNVIVRVMDRPGGERNG